MYCSKNYTIRTAFDLCESFIIQAQSSMWIAKFVLIMTQTEVRIYSRVRKKTFVQWCETCPEGQLIKYETLEAIQDDTSPIIQARGACQVAATTSHSSSKLWKILSSRSNYSSMSISVVRAQTGIMVISAGCFSVLDPMPKLFSHISLFLWCRRQLQRLSARTGPIPSTGRNPSTRSWLHGSYEGQASEARPWPERGEWLSKAADLELMPSSFGQRPRNGNLWVLNPRWNHDPLQIQRCWNHGSVDEMLMLKKQ